MQRKETAPTLHALSELEDASRALQSASLAFSPGKATPALPDGTLPQDGPSSATQPPGLESHLVTSLIGQLPRETRASLARAFSEPQTQALISSLHVGAQLAGSRRETLMAHRFHNMARLYEQVAGECAAGQASLSLRNPQENPAAALDNPRWTTGGSPRPTSPRRRASRSAMLTR